MSTPTTFFVATAGEALTVSGLDEWQDKPQVKCKDLTPDMVGDLDFLLTGERTREPVCLREDLAVFRLDEDLVEAMAELDDERLPEIADEWAIHDLASTVLLVEELRALALEAQRREEDIFLCW
jgi:hypothetical protein